MSVFLYINNVIVLVSNKKEKNDMKEFDKVIGYESVKKELEMICDTMKNIDKYKGLGVTTPRGLLLHGEPGVGKTLISQCFIEASGRNVFVCRKDNSEGVFVYKIKKVFEDAIQNAPSIVFLDDMDKFANDDKFHTNSEAYVTIQSMIDECKGKEVFVLATCNDIINLPASLLRAGRFDKVIKVNNPTGEDAVRIVEHYLKQKKYVGDIDAKEIAQILNGRSCAELETVINEAGIYAGFANKTIIDMEDMISACVRVIFNAPESMNDMSDNDIKNTAYHEAGHAVVAEILEPNSISIVSVRKHTGDTGGITGCYTNPEYWQQIQTMENRVMMLLGGKAATEIKFGQIDVGVNSDMRRAFRIVNRFVDDYCAYGFDNFIIDRSTSNELLSRKENHINNEMSRYYGMVKKILAENIEFLDGLAQELIEKKTLVARDVQRIKQTCLK